MRLVTCEYDNKEQLGFILDDQIYICSQTDPGLPVSMNDFLEGGQQSMQAMSRTVELAKKGKFSNIALDSRHIKLLAPVPYPSSFRDAYAFRQHVSTSRRNRGLEMIPEFDKFPVFYFSNHRAIMGPGSVSCMPLHFDQLDFELEVAVVLNKRGKNIPASEADQYIAGYMIMNDLSARHLQMEEMKLNLGPAKGKDFATTTGPYLVTKDELESYKVATPEGHTGDTYNLHMSCAVNGKQVCAGNLADMNWTFAEIIERVSYGVEVFPGDLIGSGTVGTGCFLELNGTGKRNDPNYQVQWLQPGDHISMQVTGLGQLDNTVVLEPINKY
ncbi:fumarylacetoacetate hydrolase family protein [Sphingobacterium spiritivorum]|uniref:fumarylacetoacetate hydrolase family protein n=1 Tax=Sphingobacterium spiritivorum TaxID=258 RepID=UPI003DA59840